MVSGIWISEREDRGVRACSTERVGSCRDSITPDVSLAQTDLAGARAARAPRMGRDITATAAVNRLLRMYGSHCAGVCPKATQKPVRLDHSPDCIRAQSPKTRVAARRCLFQLLWALTFPPFKSTSAVQIHGELCGMYDVQFHHPQVWIRFTPSHPKLCDFLFIVNDLG